MKNFRIALGNLRFPSTPEQSVALVGEAIAKAAEEGALIVCFPECYVPGYRGFGMEVQRPDAGFLKRAWEAVAQAAAQARVAVILGTERIVDTGAAATALGPAAIPRRSSDIWNCDLSRGLALPRDGTVGGATRCASCVSPSLSHRRARWLRAVDVR